MDSILEQVFKEEGWRFPKGYPDVSIPEEKSKLFELLQQRIDETPSMLSQEAIDILSKEFDLDASKFKELSPNKFKVLMSNAERSPFIEKAKNLKDFDHELKGGSKGQIRYKDKILFLPKPEHVQGQKSAGKENEDIFINSINNAIEENDGSIDIILSSPEHTEKFNNVTFCMDSSKDGAGKGDKSDARLLSGKETLANISLKKDGGFRWATLRTLMPNLLQSIIQKGEKGEIPTLGFEKDERGTDKYKMVNPQTGERVTLVVIEDIPKEYDELIIFGKEKIKPIIVSKTFSFGDFEVNNGILNIKCSHIYKNMDDIKKAKPAVEPVIVLAQHIGQKFGIDFRAYPAFMAQIGPKQKGIKLNYNDIK